MHNNIYNDRINKVLTFIDENLNEKISLDLMAEEDLANECFN